MGTPEAAVVGAALSFPIAVLPVVSAGRPPVLGLKGKTYTSLDGFLLCEVEALTPGVLCLDEPKVTGTLPPLVVGAVLFFPIIGPPLLWAGWLSVLGFNVDLDMSFHPFLLASGIGFPPGEVFLCLDDPWVHFRVLGPPAPPTVETVLWFPTTAPRTFWTGWPQVPGFKVALEACPNTGTVLALLQQQPYCSEARPALSDQKEERKWCWVPPAVLPPIWMFRVPVSERGLGQRHQTQSSHRPWGLQVLLTHVELE